jgi:hypothetical protein
MEPAVTVTWLTALAVLLCGCNRHTQAEHTQAVNASSNQAPYRANPALFARRRIYRTLTFSIAQPELTHTLRNALDQTHSAIQVRQLLDRQHVNFEAVETTRPAEEIPIDILPQLAQASIGDVLIAAPSQQARALLICVVDVRDSALDFQARSLE